MSLLCCDYIRSYYIMMNWIRLDNIRLWYNFVCDPNEILGCCLTQTKIKILYVLQATIQCKARTVWTVFTDMVDIHVRMSDVSMRVMSVVVRGRWHVHIFMLCMSRWLHEKTPTDGLSTETSMCENKSYCNKTYVCLLLFF